MAPPPLRDALALCPHRPLPPLPSPTHLTLAAPPGSTDDLGKRLDDHRRRGPVHDRSLEAACSAVYLQQGANSSARELEALAIRTLRDAGFPLLSDHDARRRHGPRAADPPVPAGGERE